MRANCRLLRSSRCSSSPEHSTARSGCVADVRMSSGAQADHPGYAQIAVVAMAAASYWGDLPPSTNANMSVAALTALAPTTVRAHHPSFLRVTETFLVLGLVPSRRHHSCCMEQLAHGKWASCRPRHRIRSRMFRSEPNGRHRWHEQQPRGRVSKHAESSVNSVGKLHSQCREGKIGRAHV